MLFFSFSLKCKISSLKEKVKIISESELEICALIYRPQLESISVSIFLFTSVAIACKRGCFSLLIAPEGRLLPHSKSCLFQWGFSSDGQMMLEGSTFRLSKCYFSRLFHTERSWPAFWFSVVFVSVSIKNGLRTADHGLRTGYKIRTRYKMRTPDWV